MVTKKSLALIRWKFRSENLQSRPMWHRLCRRRIRNWFSKMKWILALTTLKNYKLISKYKNICTFIQFYYIDEHMKLDRDQNEARQHLNFEHRDISYPNLSKFSNNFPCSFPSTFYEAPLPHKSTSFMDLNLKIYCEEVL